MPDIGFFATFNEAYASSARYLRQHADEVDPTLDPSSVGSNFGTAKRPSREVMGFQFSLTNPRSRLLSPLVRRISLPFAIANAIWTFKGANDLDMIVFYNPRGRDFSRDGIQLEAAFGHRLFGGENQIAHICDRITTDSASRRGFGVIYDQSDTFIDRLDVPCAIGIHFLRRRNGLDATVIMRSQSALMVLPYDVFLFSLLHELVARRLDLPLGQYHHYSSSFHYYIEEQPVADMVCDSCQVEDGCEMPGMPPVTSEILPLVIKAEESIRKRFDEGKLDGINLQEFGLAPFWRQLLGVLLVYALRKAGGEPDQNDWSWLPSAYRRMLW